MHLTVALTISFQMNFLLLKFCMQGKGPAGGGSQVACWNFKMCCVGILSRVHVAVGN